MFKGLHSEFKDRISRLTGSEAGLLMESCVNPPRQSIRVNTLKTSVKACLKALEPGFTLERVPWCGTGFYMEGDGLSSTLEYFLGHYYIQDAASMIPPEALKPRPGELALDLTASPGGKTTHMAALMGNRGLLVANEGNHRRIGALRFNLSKYGILNAVVTGIDARESIEAGMLFDKILLDAPCSGEGMFGVSRESVMQWSAGKIRRNSMTQKKIMENTVRLLAEGGALVYSTCTYAPEENEAVVDTAIDLGLTVEEFRLDGLETRPGIVEWEGKVFDESVSKCVRVYPFINESIGFFTAKMVKK
ncbi:MAG: RsmB/NOP family class I SAM-dependent RNA methyltransferase [Candidatus Altiarchaeota archaeon]